MTTTTTTTKSIPFEYNVISNNKQGHKNHVNNNNNKINNGYNKINNNSSLKKCQLSTTTEPNMKSYKKKASTTISTTTTTKRASIYQVSHNKVYLLNRPISQPPNIA